MFPFSPYRTLTLTAALVMLAGREAFGGGAPLFLGGPGHPRRSKNRTRARRRPDGWRDKKRSRRLNQKRARRLSRDR